MLPIDQFLTPEECYLVDTALLSSQDKFSTRLAIYGLRCLQKISQEMGLPIEQITSEQVREWVRQEPTIREQLEMDESFENFFSNMVISSFKPLKQIGQTSGISLENLGVQQVIQWFEGQRK